MAAKKKILIVEDNLINREVLGSILSPVYEVLEAENGEEGLAFLKEQKAGLSLILLDIPSIIAMYSLQNRRGLGPAVSSVSLPGRLWRAAPGSFRWFLLSRELTYWMRFKAAGDIL